MTLMRVMVYLNTGAQKEHLEEVEDNDDYINKMNYYLDVLKGEQGTILGFSLPVPCVYKVQNVVAIEFTDALLPPEKLPIGFRPRIQD